MLGSNWVWNSELDFLLCVYMSMERLKRSRSLPALSLSLYLSLSYFCFSLLHNFSELDSIRFTRNSAPQIPWKSTVPVHTDQRAGPTRSVFRAALTLACWVFHSLSIYYIGISRCVVIPSNFGARWSESTCQYITDIPWTPLISVPGQPFSDKLHYCLEDLETRENFVQSFRYKNLPSRIWDLFR